MHGRIWTHLFLSKVPLDALDLRKRLGISKALVSLSLRDLLRYEVIEEMGKSERGTIIYRATTDVRRAIFNVLRSRERKLISSVLLAHRIVEGASSQELTETQIDSQKLSFLGEMIDAADKILDQFLLMDAVDADKLQSFFKDLGKAPLVDGIVANSILKQQGGTL